MSGTYASYQAGDSAGDKNFERIAQTVGSNIQKISQNGMYFEDNMYTSYIHC